MKITGIVGSPRNDKTTDALVSAILSAAEETGASVTIRHLGDLKVNGCLACMACRSTGECAQKDDMQILYKDLMESDGLVLGTPIYFSTMTAQMKAFTDRLWAFTTFINDDLTSRLEGGRRAVLAVTQGAPDAETFAPQIENIAKVWGWVGINVEDTIVVPGVETREDITGSTEVMDRVRATGKALGTPPI